VDNLPSQVNAVLGRIRHHVSSEFLYFMVLLSLFGHVRAILGYVYDHMIKGSKNLTKSYGPWAVVTGATDGIGLAMASEFARKGMNVVLMSRTQSKLENCAKEIKEKFPKIDVKILAFDFNEINDPSQRKKISKFLSSLDIGILVNNVGVSYPFPKYIYELTDDETEALTVLNVDTTVWMTRIVLDGDNGMISRKKGAIINIASIAGVLTSPLLSHYGGSKGFVAQYSRALHYELAPKGVHVQCQVPFFVATKLAKIRKSSLTVASPTGYARAAIKAIGSGVVVSPYWSHAIQFWLYQSLPEWILASVASSMHLGIRKAGMKKVEALSKTK